MVCTALKDAGVPLDELETKLMQEFPKAVETVKTSVDKNIVGAQQTMTDSTEKMKIDAEANLSDIQKAAEDAAGGVSTATVMNWGNSAVEVEKNLDQMKQTANLKLAEMQKTIDSHFTGQYNTMTNKWKWAGDRIAQLIADMIWNTKESWNNLHRI